MFIILANNKNGIENINEIENAIYGGRADEKVNRCDPRLINYILASYIRNEMNYEKNLKIVFVNKNFDDDISISGTFPEYVVSQDENIKCFTIEPSKADKFISSVSKQNNKYGDFRIDPIPQYDLKSNIDWSTLPDWEDDQEGASASYISNNELNDISEMINDYHPGGHVTNNIYDENYRLRLNRFNQHRLNQPGYGYHNFRNDIA